MPTLRPLYNDFERSRVLGRNNIEIGVHKFVLEALQRTPRASVLSLGSIAMRNMLCIVKNWTEMAENE